MIAFLGLLLLTWAWWDLVRRVSGCPGGVRLTRLTTAAWIVPLLIAPPLFSKDGWSYVATGYLAGHHLSPYVVTPSVLPPPLLSGVAIVWRSTTSPYGPLPLVWGGIFSRLSADPWLLLYSYRALALLGLALLATAVPRLARRVGRDPARASALAVASPFLLAHGIGGLHNDVLVAALAVTAISVTGRDRWWWGACLAGLAAAVKVPGVTAAVGVVLLSLAPAASLLRRLGRTAQVMIVAIGTLLGVSWGSGLGTGWISGLSSTADAPVRMAPASLLGQGLDQLLGATGLADHALRRHLHLVNTSRGLGELLAVLVIGWVLLRRKTPDTAAGLTGAAVAMLAVTVLGPALHYWYFLWCLPLLACVPLSRRNERAFVVLLALLGVAAFADPALHIAWLFRPALTGLYVGPAVAWLLGESFGRTSTGPSGPPRPVRDES